MASVQQPKTGPSLVLWDVDHTLIENGGVSKENYALAFELLTGARPVVPAQTHGRTDVGIMENLLSAHDVEPGTYTPDERIAALTEAGRQNQGRLAERGYVLAGAWECMARLAQDSKVIQSVLTGNVEPNARIN